MCMRAMCMTMCMSLSLCDMNAKIMTLNMEISDMSAKCPRKLGHQVEVARKTPSSSWYPEAASRRSRR